MKTYFIRLFSYDQYANQCILKAIADAGNPPKAVKLMAHLLAAQQVWLNRCKELPVNNVKLWPDWEADTFNKVITKNSGEWLTYLNGLTPDDLNRSFSYKNLRGDNFENRLTDMLTQTINHGTHHRAQIGQQLKFAGADALPVTDYIAYIRQFNS